MSHWSGSGRLTGGIRINSRKLESTARPIRMLPPTGELFLPLRLYDGSQLQPLVEPGERVLRGQLIARAADGLPACLHAPSSGEVLGVRTRAVTSLQRSEDDCLVILCDGRDTPDPAIRPPPDYRALTPPQIRTLLDAGGLAGLGGAVYPTSAKWASAARPMRGLIVNGAECEPYISCDDLLMRERAAQVLSGARMAMEMLGVEQACIAIETDKSEALHALQKALEETDGPRIDILTVPTVYPSGGERQLVELLTGEEVPSGGFPTDIGYLCHNVATMAALHRYVSTGEPLISRVVTVTGGGVREPLNLEARFGTPASRLVEAAGGYRAGVRRLIVGGGMTGIAVATDEVPVTRASNCFIAAMEDQVRDTQPPLPCIRCGDCAAACPARLLPQQLYAYRATDDHETWQSFHLRDCIECGCCDVVCPSHIPLAQTFREMKHRLWLGQMHADVATRASRRYQRHSERQQRRAAQEQEARENALGPLDDDAEAQRTVEDALNRARARRRQRGGRGDEQP